MKKKKSCFGPHVLCGHMAVVRHNTEMDFTDKHSKLRQEISQNVMIKNVTRVKGENKYRYQK